MKRDGEKIFDIHSRVQGSRTVRVIVGSGLRRRIGEVLIYCIMLLILRL